MIITKIYYCHKEMSQALYEPLNYVPSLNYAIYWIQCSSKLVVLATCDHVRQPCVLVDSCDFHSELTALLVISISHIFLQITQNWWKFDQTPRLGVNLTWCLIKILPFSQHNNLTLYQQTHNLEPNRLVHVNDL